MLFTIIPKHTQQISRAQYHLVKTHIYPKVKLILKLQNNDMADINHHFRNLHLQNLVDQNEELRRRIAKLTEIEGYVELLVDKLEKADVREKSLSSENNVLRQQTRELEIKYSKSQTMHGDEMRYVFGQHDQIIEQKNMAVEQLKALLDKQSSRANQMEAQIRFQKANEQKLVAQYEEALISYRNRVGQMEQDLQIVYKTLEDEKIQHAKTKECWITEANQFKQSLKEKEGQNARLREEVSSLVGATQGLQNQVNSLIEYNQKLETRLKNTEDDSAKRILTLNRTIEQLSDALVKKQNQCESLQANKQSLLQEIQIYKDTQLKLKSDNQIYVTDNQRLIFLLDESDKENQHLREQHQELQEYSTEQIQKLKIDSLRLREENNVLKKNSAERQTYLGTKLVELKQSNAARSSLQVFIEQAQAQILSLRAELQETQTSLINEKHLSTQLELERKKLTEAFKLLKQENMNLDDMNKRIQKENYQLSKESHNLARLLNNPREQNKEYLEQMDKVVKTLHEERQEQNLRHKAEKEKLKEMYEYELKQKEMEMMREIAVLQQQLTKMAKLDVLIERGGNKPTPPKVQLRTPLKR